MDQNMVPEARCTHPGGRNDMRQQIAVEDLRQGMYVSSLDRPWVGTPFLFQGFEIRDNQELAVLRRLCRHVYIDQTPPEARHRQRKALPSLSSEPLTPAPRHADRSLADILAGPTRADALPGRLPSLPLEQEMGPARELENHTRELVYTLMDDVRMGRTLDSVRARHLVAGMVDSIARNADALLWMTHLKSRDEYTALHSLRVSILALTFGHHLKLPSEELKLLGMGALLHDLGKLCVPSEILNKPGRLTPAEYEIMKTHVPHGVRLLEATPGIPAAAVEVARCHHERYSGSGYIHGFTGDRIGLFGMIGAIVDTYDAITSDRVYHAGRSADDALRRLYDARGREFHAGLVEQFIQCMGIYPIGSLVELNTGAVGIVLSNHQKRHLRPCLVVVLDPEKQRYPQPSVIDLLDDRHAELAIRSVLPAGAYGLDPGLYVPKSA